ncbi:MAG: hypothetical protein II530_01470, partial [Bacteroidaceae bacterium]|nr:hypothetical protein [Bacteroidaceae bacterium]
SALVLLLSVYLKSIKDRLLDACRRFISGKRMQRYCFFLNRKTKSRKIFSKTCFDSFLLYKTYNSNPLKKVVASQDTTTFTHMTII